MNFLDLLRAVFGLAFTLGLIGLVAWGVRRYAPQLLAKLGADRGQRRMQVVETLVLDPARRLVLVRVDDENRLILLGEGRELIEPRQGLDQPAPLNQGLDLQDLDQAFMDETPSDRGPA